MATILRVIPEDTYNKLVQLGVLDEDYKPSDQEPVLQEPEIQEPEARNNRLSSHAILEQIDEPYRDQSRLVLEKLGIQGNFDCNTNGELIYKDKLLLGSNVAHLVQSLFDKDKCDAKGVRIFWRMLQQDNLISQFINIREVTTKQYEWITFEQEFSFV